MLAVQQPSLLGQGQCAAQWADSFPQAQVPVLAYKEEQPPALSHSVYESLVCNEFLEVIHGRSVQDQYWGIRKAILL